MKKQLTSYRSPLKFKSLTEEISRTYTFPGGDKVTIVKPKALNVSASGGHRILDGEGTSHYVPRGWIHLTWVTRKYCAAFTF